ncbi:MAG: patatin-like phospholipase family protein [Gemmatimonadota bacterium]|nr:patatin-like phospholipase family protein [Gemmatimonadota bacterium]
MTAQIPERTALVLGGGGLKGFAHIGVLRALTERGIEPALYAGTSIGSLIAAARVCGMSTDEMARRALSLRRRDLFRLNHLGMLMELMRAPSLYLAEPLQALCESVIGGGTFHTVGDLAAPLLVNTVDVERGTQLVWGLPGLRDVPIADAVYASCALPGFFPPGQVDNRVCIDGGTMDNLPVAAASLGMQAVIAVDVGNFGLTPAKDIAAEGFGTIFMRAATVMMHALQQVPLTSWTGPPMLLIRPKIAHLNWFSFAHTQEIIDAGYEAAIAALDLVGDCLLSPTGVYPRRPVSLEVDRDKCIGCGTCVAMAPRLMALDSSGKAYAVSRHHEWSPADGDFVHHCPTEAITAQFLDGTRRRTSAPEKEPTLDAADD